MARLYDRMAAYGTTGCVDGYHVPVDLRRPSDLTAMRRRFDEATVLVADDVARYFFSDNPKEVWRSEDFPAVVPPISPLWIEARAPSRILSEEKGELGWGSIRLEKAWAWLVESRQEHGSWTVRASLFADLRHLKGPAGPLMHWQVRLRPDGTLPPRMPEIPPRSNPWIFVCTGVPGREEDDRRHARASDPLLDVAWLALGFMHCKNVEVRDAPTPPAPLEKKWQKRHGRPLVRYKVLDIDPMRRVLESEGGASTNGLKKALHICRGHFATYTEDAPLFGRHVGTYWKPQHVRGTAQAGAVVKDYRVKAPR